MNDAPNVNGPQIAEGFPGQRSVVLPRSVVSSWLSSEPLFDMIPSDVGFYPSAQWHFVDRPTGSPQLILIYCVAGEGWGRVGGVEVRVRPGEALVVPPNTPHSYGADPDSPWTIYWVHMTGKKAKILVRMLELEPGATSLFPGQDPALPTLFERLIHILSQGYTSDNLLFSATELHQLSTHLVTIRHRRPGGRDANDAKIKKAIDIMNLSLDRDLTIGELASAVNLSVSHFSFIFKKRTGFSAIDYFVRLKMQRACFMLDETATSVKEIAASLGFDDPLYFSRRFRQIHNRSPRQYQAIRKG
jgi:AraC-like DNA-binding protein